MAIKEIGVRTVIENLGGFLRGMDRYNTAIAKAEQRTQRFSERATKTGAALTAIAAPLIAIGFLSARVFAAFEQSMARVEAITGATADQMIRLEDVAREMGRTTVFTAREAAGALAFMAQAGLSVEEQISALPNVLQLAAAGQLDLATSADIITNILAGQQLGTDQLAGATDTLVKAFTSANTNLVQLGSAFRFAGPVAAAAGVSFEEQAAILGLLGDAGIQATLAGTSLRGATARLIAPTKATQRIIDQLGVTVFDSGGKIRSFADIIEDLETAGIQTGQVMELFGLRAGPAMLRLLSVGSVALREFTESLTEAGGTAARIAEVQLNTLQGDLTKTTSAAEGAQISIGEALAPSLRALTGVLIPVLTFVGSLADRFPLLTTVVIAAALVLGTVGIGLLAVGFILPGVIAGVGLLATGFVFLSGAVVAVAVALGPVTLIVLGITAAVVAGIVVWKLWGDQLGKVVDVLRLVLQLLFPITAALTLIESFTGFDIPGIRGFAHGGTAVTSGPAIVGERGPELVHLPAGAQVSPVTNGGNSFNVTANYTDRQEPQSIRLDLEALTMMTSA